MEVYLSNVGHDSVLVVVRVTKTEFDEIWQIRQQEVGEVVTCDLSITRSSASRGMRLAQSSV